MQADTLSRAFAAALGLCVAAGLSAADSRPPATDSAAPGSEATVSEAAAQEPDARAWYLRAMAAYQAKDYIAFLENIQQAARLSPDRPEFVYKLAAASALVGNKPEALAQLRRLVELKTPQDVAGHPDFDSLRDNPEFVSLAAAMKSLKKPVGESVTAFTLTEKDLIVEGIAHDPVSGDFFVSSVHKRKILRVDRKGRSRDFTSESQDGLWAVLGLRVDSQRRVLWACSTSVPQMIGSVPQEARRGTLFRYDLTTGALARRYPLGGGEAGHGCNDLTVAANGDVYVSDEPAGQVLTLAAGAVEFSTLVPSGTIGSPQGLALSEGDRHLFVADYDAGIVRVDLTTREVRPLGRPADLCLLGIDGLTRHAGSLIAIQNGISPSRVVRLTLDPAMERVQGGAILEMNNPSFDEPTLGVIAGKHLYYVANSQWRRFNADGTIYPLNRLAEPIILKMPL